MGEGSGRSLFGTDFAKGSRNASGGGSDDITFSRHLGNKILSGIVNAVFGTRYTDLCYGYNAFWAKHLPKIDLVDSSWEHNRLHGQSNLKVARDGIRIARFIIRERLSGNRERGANARLGTPQAAV